MDCSTVSSFCRLTNSWFTKQELIIPSYLCRDVYYAFPSSPLPPPLREFISPAYTDVVGRTKSEIFIYPKRNDFETFHPDCCNFSCFDFPLLHFFSSPLFFILFPIVFRIIYAPIFEYIEAMANPACFINRVYLVCSESWLHVHVKLTKTLCNILKDC